MIVKITCLQCGQEKEVEVKVPKFCSSECRKEAFKAMVKKRWEAKNAEVQTEPTVNSEELESDVNN